MRIICVRPISINRVLLTYLLILSCLAYLCTFVVYTKR